MYTHAFKLLMRAHFLALLLVAHVSGISPASKDYPTIVVDLSGEDAGVITAALLGANNSMTGIPGTADFDTATKRFDPNFENNMELLGLRSLRFPGGNDCGTYYWWKGLGPYPRPPGINAMWGFSDSDYYEFGFMEFMEFLESIGGADPIIVINFGTGTAQQASSWVEFANGEVGGDPNGDGIDFAQFRADLGHPEPFDIRFWEIGNELSSGCTHMFSWHYGQLSDDSVDYSRTVENYIFGGEQWQFRDLQWQFGEPFLSEIGQHVVKDGYWYHNACLSNGDSNQVFYVKYPPVEPDSFRLAVCTSTSWGEEWQMVDDLSLYGWDAKVFTLDTLTGRITFGNGHNGSGHGLIPPESTSIRVQYKAILKDGLVDFYCKMKRSDPTIKIGVPFCDSIFYQAVAAAGFEELPFDFVVEHRYTNGKSWPLQIEHWRIHWAAKSQGDALLRQRALLDSFFSGYKEIGIVVSEYNLVYKHDRPEYPILNPWYRGEQLDFFGRSLDQGLYVAGALISFLRNAEASYLWALDVHSIISYTDDEITGWPCTALMGPKPYQYINPAGYIYSLFSQCYQHRILAPQMGDTPEYEFVATDTLRLPYLDALATVSPSGDTAMLFVMNRASGLPEAGEAYGDITATIKFENASRFTTLTFYELNAESLWSVNSAEYPDRVSISVIGEQPFAEHFQYTFPAHSITAIECKVRECDKGDVNGDGEVTILDVICTVNIILELYEPTPGEFCAADCNSDGAVDLLDVMGIVNVILSTGSCSS